MMKKLGLVLVVALFTVVFPFQGGAWTVGDINSDNRIDMTEAIHALQIVSSVRTAASTGESIAIVPGGGMTIQQAIDAAAPGDTINVAAGTYSETLTIKNKALILQGAGAGVTVINGISGCDVLAIDGGRGVVVSGLTIKGGENGINASRGAVLEVTAAVIEDAAKKGILIQGNSTARLKNVAVQRSGVDGIQAFLNSSIIISEAVSSNKNIRHGIIIASGSSAFFSGATVTANANAYRGVNIVTNAGLLLDNSSLTIKDDTETPANLGRGLQVFGSSSLLLQNNSSVIVENTGYDGIGIGSSSSLAVVDSSSSLTVNASGRNGITAWSGSSLVFLGTTVVQNNKSNGITLIASTDLYSSGQLTVEKNKETGIYLANGSQATLYPTSPKTVVIRNNAVGIRVSDGSGVTGNGASFTFTPNTTRDVEILFGSRASIPTSSYSTIFCSQSVNTMGVSCP
jgi:hypothetical protein